MENFVECFSPRNGEVILKVEMVAGVVLKATFQSPQWGSNSKTMGGRYKRNMMKFQSPQWGSNSKNGSSRSWSSSTRFQSPQWGSNSKNDGITMAANRL